MNVPLTMKVLLIISHNVSGLIYCCSNQCLEDIELNIKRFQAAVRTGVVTAF